MKRPQLARSAVLFVIIAVYAAVRLFGMTAACLWFDEIFSVHAAEHSWNSILAFISLDLIHPPLFYVLLKLWIGIGGDGLFWVRLFPVAFSVLAVFPFIAFCRELKLSFWTQIFALLLFATNGTLIKYSQEVRMYSLLLCLSLFSMWLFAKYFARGKSLILLVIVNILLVYTHYFGWLVITAEISSIMLFQRIKWRPILIMFGVTLVSFLPWSIAVLQAAKSSVGLSQNIGWIDRPGILPLIQLALGLVEPFYFQTNSDEPISILRVSLPMLAILIVSPILYLSTTKTENDEDKLPIKLFLSFAVLPLFIVFVASWALPYSVWGTRHLIFIFAPFSILFALVITRMNSLRTRTAIITLVLLLIGYGFLLSPPGGAGRNSWCGCEPMAAIAAEMGPGNIYTFEDLVAYHVWYGSRGNTTKGPVSKVSGIEGLTEDRSYFLPRGFDEVTTVDFMAINDARLFIVFRAKQIDEREQPVRSFLVRGYRIKDKFVVEAKDGDTIMLYLEK